MAEAKSGDKVKIHYKGTLDDGTVFDDSNGREPLEVTLGSKQVIPGFENMVIGMAVGDTKSGRIESKDAYGDRREELVFEVPRDKFPAEIKPEVGQSLMMQQQGGQAAPVQVVAVGDASITMDANSPLAGKDLNFEIKLVEIVA